MEKTNNTINAQQLNTMVFDYFENTLGCLDHKVDFVTLELIPWQEAKQVYTFLTEEHVYYSFYIREENKEALFAKFDDSIAVEICEECGRTIVYNKEFRPFTEVNTGEQVCNVCLPMDYVRCAHCEEWINRDDVAVEVGENYFCSFTCATADGYERCDRCDEWVHDYDISEVYAGHRGPEHWCAECRYNHAFFCNHCETSYSEFHYDCHCDVDGDTLCDGCFDDYGGCCEQCNEEHYTDNLYWDEASDGYLCEDCLHAQEERDSANPTGKSGKEYKPRDIEEIYGYHRYPSDWSTMLCHHEQYNSALKFGIELELYGSYPTSAKASVIREAIENGDGDDNHIWASHDGSLEGYGFELISQPANAAYHLNLDGKGYAWDKGMSTAVDLGFVSHNGGKCGLHFHVNRDFFDVDDPEGNVAIILSNNSEWLKRFSRRQYFGYCSFSQAEKYSFREDEFKDMNVLKANAKIGELKHDMRGHGRAVNFSNTHTIEFRFIRGTLKYQTFVAALQLVHMFCEFADSEQETCAAVTLRSFISLAKKRKYKEFLAYLVERKIVPDSVRNADGALPPVDVEVDVNGTPVVVYADEE